VIEDRKQPAGRGDLLLDRLKIARGRAEDHLRIDRPLPQRKIVVDLRTGGAAAVVAEAVDVQPVVQARLADEVCQR
jgi:hypothetical protein